MSATWPVWYIIGRASQASRDSFYSLLFLTVLRVAAKSIPYSGFPFFEQRFTFWNDILHTYYLFIIADMPNGIWFCATVAKLQDFFCETKSLFCTFKKLTSNAYLKYKRICFSWYQRGVNEVYKNVLSTLLTISHQNWSPSLNLRSRCGWSGTTCY